MSPMTLAVAVLFAQLKDEADDAAKAQHAYYRREASELKFSLGGETPQDLMLEPRPVMSWSADGGWSGSVFVWTHDGRPELIGCVGSGPQSGARRGVFHEFHSLAVQPLAPVAIEGARKWTWEPEKGVEPRPIAGAEPPAESPAARLVQMRVLARDFNVTMVVDDKPWELRMATQPLYRFPKREGSSRDGAIFGYLWSTGTDPEFLLTLETRDAGGELAWHWSPVRFSYRELKVEQDGEQVWHAEPYGEQWKSAELKEPYVTVPVKSVPASEVEQTREDEPGE